MTYKRIVSLTPSLTETLFALGAGDRVKGVTDACDYPPEVSSIPHVCSWVDPDMARIMALEPDLVVGLASAHQRLRPLFQASDTVLELFNPPSVTAALSDMRTLGNLLQLPETAEKMVSGLADRLERLAAKVNRIPPDKRLTVSRVLDIDKENLIVAGPLSFQFDVIKQAGGLNVSTAINEAYPKIPFQTFRAWNPAMIFLCGTDRSYISRLQSDPRWQPLAAIRNRNIHLFDCGLTCRTGPRIVDMAELLFQTLYA